MQIVIWVEWPLLNSSNDFQWWIFPKLWWQGLTVCSPANVGLEAKTLGWPPPSPTRLMFAAEMLRHFAAEIWNSLCNLICSSSYKTWKCCNKLKFTIPRFRRRFCFFLVSSCKDCWRFLSLLLELFFSSSAFFWHFYNKSAISNLYLLWIGSSVYWPQDLKSIPLLMYDWWPLMFNKEGSK